MNMVVPQYEMTTEPGYTGWDFVIPLDSLLQFSVLQDDPTSAAPPLREARTESVDPRLYHAILLTELRLSQLQGSIYRAKYPKPAYHHEVSNRTSHGFRTVIRLGYQYDEFNTVLSRVNALPHEDDEDGPTTYALEETLALLDDARPLVGAAFPRATASTTIDGGIDVYWKRPDRYLQLSIPASRNGARFIYHDDGQAKGVAEDPRPASLARWIRWFLGA
jgi:hypothetical protein